MFVPAILALAYLTPVLPQQHHYPSFNYDGSIFQSMIIKRNASSNAIEITDLMKECARLNAKAVPICQDDKDNQCECKKGNFLLNKECQSLPRDVGLQSGSVILAESYNCDVHKNLKKILKAILSNSRVTGHLETYVQQVSQEDKLSLDFFVFMKDESTDVVKTIRDNCELLEDGTCELKNGDVAVKIQKKESIQSKPDYDPCLDEDSECMSLIHDCKVLKNKRYECSCQSHLDEIRKSRNIPICQARDVCKDNQVCKSRGAECIATNLGHYICVCKPPLLFSSVDGGCHPFCEAKQILCYNGGTCDDVTQSCICPDGWTGNDCEKTNIYRKWKDESSTLYFNLSIALGVVLGALIISNIISVCLMCR